LFGRIMIGACSSQPSAYRLRKTVIIDRLELAGIHVNMWTIERKWLVISLYIGNFKLIDIFMVCMTRMSLP